MPPKRQARDFSSAKVTELPLVALDVPPAVVLFPPEPALVPHTLAYHVLPRAAINVAVDVVGV